MIGLDQLEELAQKGPVILMLWHNRLCPLAHILYPLSSKRDFSAFVSKSKDGEILSQFVLSYKGGKVIRVAHNQKNAALKAMVETLRKNEAIVMITPDGPRGPVYKVKPGVKFAAEETGAKIIPFNWKGDKYWELKSWDGFRIPKPFSRIEAAFGEPLTGDASLDKLKASLDTL